MKKLYLKWVAALLLTLVLVPAVWATIPNITGFNTRADGNTVTASIWNTELGGIYTYLNNNIVPALNTLTTAGDIFVHDGASLIRLGQSGNNGDVLTIDTGLAHKIKWAAPGGTGLTTTGDTLYYSAGNQRLAVGTAGQVLTVSGGLPSWQSNSSNIPTGGIIMWSGSIASIPAGWHLCDGTTGTPNLQGFFIVGAGNVSPAGGGLGLKNPGTLGGALTSTQSHTHGVSLTGSTGPNSASATGDATPNTSFASSNHSHAVTLSGTTASASVTHSTIPPYYALAYIMKI